MRKTPFDFKYEGKSICNILPTLAQFNNIKTSDGFKRFELETGLKKRFIRFLTRADRIVILQVDALGYDLFAGIKKKYSFLNSSTKISSVFPTYTHSAFASFITGTPPSSHGVVAGTFLKDGRVNWMGSLAKSKNSFKNVILTDSLLWEFNKQGKKVISILYDVNSDNYSKYLYPNIEAVSSRSSQKDFIKQAYEVEKRVFKKALQLRKRDYYILSIYFWYLDGVSGLKGKFSEETSNFLNFFFEQVENLIKAFPKRTLFLLMGDHGHTSLRKTVVVDQKKIEEINNKCGAKFALDGRVMMFYTQNSALTRKLFKEIVGDNVFEISREKYIKMLGGNCSKRVENRIGNLIYLAKPYCTVRFQAKTKKATHGGPSKEEAETVLGFFMK